MEYLKMGERLRALRRAKQLTQKQVSERLGIAVSTLSGYELEEKHPSYAMLMKLAKLYDVSTDYLIGMEDVRNINVSGLNDNEIKVITDMITILKEAKHSNK